MGDIYTNPPQSRNEAILRATIDGTEYTAPPQSRIEDLLLELKEAIEEGGGSVESYEQLTNKPQINETTLSGNKTTEDLIPIGDGLQINADGELETADAYIPASEKGTASGVATLTEAGKVPEAQLPSYVDDAIEGYLYEGHFYADSAHTEEITGERGKIYVDLDTNRAYRWTGSTFVEIGDNNTFTANRALVSDANGKVSASSATSEEVGYLSGVTGAIQTQLDGKQNTLTFDTTPTAQSTNPVTSGGIKTYVDGQGAKSVSGNPITLTDAEGMSADHVVATITTTQDLHGYSNPWAGGTGKNKFGGELETLFPCKFNAQTTVTASIKANSGASCSFNWYNSSGTRIDFVSINNSYGYQRTVTFGQDVYYVSFSAYGGTVEEMQVELGDEATSYEPYANICPFSGQTNAVEITVADAPTDPTETKTVNVQLGNIYAQAKLNATNGKLVADKGYIEYDGSSDEEWFVSGYGVNNQYGIVLPNLKAHSASWAKLAGLLCDKWKTITFDAGYGYTDFGISGSNGADLRFSIPKDIVDRNVSGFKTYLSNNPIKVVYPFETTLEIQLTPTQIALLENNNTITTNVSSLDITYQTNSASGDTASALDKRVTRLETKVPQPPTTDGTYKLTVTVASGEPTYSWESAT